MIALRLVSKAKATLQTPSLASNRNSFMFANFEIVERIGVRTAQEARPTTSRNVWPGSNGKPTKSGRLRDISP